MKKFGTMFVVLLLALGLVGATYAVWTDQLIINGSVATGKLDVRFSDEVEFTDTDDGTEYDIGEVACDISEDGKTGVVTITDAYPGYSASCKFTIENVGSIPAEVKGITTNVPEVLTVTTSGVSVGEVIDANFAKDLTLTVTCGEVGENTEYEFTVTLEFEQI